MKLYVCLQLDTENNYPAAQKQTQFCDPSELRQYLAGIPNESVLSNFDAALPKIEDGGAAILAHGDKGSISVQCLPLEIKCNPELCCDREPEAN